MDAVEEGSGEIEDHEDAVVAIRLSNNRLAGDLGVISKLGGMTALSEIVLAKNNGLTGTVPATAELGQTSEQAPSLAIHVPFSGQSHADRHALHYSDAPIPAHFAHHAHAPQLTVLDLADTSLSGTIHFYDIHAHDIGFPWLRELHTEKCV